VGYYNVKSEADEGDPFDNTDEEASTFGIGVDLGYSWLMGKGNTKVYLSLGIGAVCLLGGDLPEDANATLPTIRLADVEIAF
jgi:hypothetical protein